MKVWYIRTKKTHEPIGFHGVANEPKEIAWAFSRTEAHEFFKGFALHGELEIVEVVL